MGANDKVAATFHGDDPLDQIRARLEAATPGPWDWEPVLLNGDTPFKWCEVDVMDGEVNDPTYIFGKHVQTPQTDAEFIANAPTDTRRLLNALGAARNIPPLTDRENGDEMFLLGWEAAIEEVTARINEALGEP